MKMNNGWIKKFEDGTSELGYDHLIEEKKASWTRGRQDGIMSVEMSHGDLYTCIDSDIPAEYYQYDEYESSAFGETELIERVIMCKADDRFYYNHAWLGTTTLTATLKPYDKGTIIWNKDSNGEMVVGGYANKIDPNNLNKWLAVCMNIPEQTVNWKYIEWPSLT